MRRPKVRPENFEAVYDFYEKYEPSEGAARRGFKLLGLLNKPTIRFAPGAKERIEHAAHDDAERLIVTANHVSNQDFFSLIAMVPDALPQSTIGRVKVPGKADIFHFPYPRRTIEHLGIFPVFRGKDFDGIVGLSDEHKVEMREKALARYDALAVRFMEQDKVMGILPEGFRNKKHPDTVQPLRKGLGQWLDKMDPSLVPVIIPTGIRHLSLTRSEIFIDHPIEGPFEAPLEIGELLRPCIQAAVTELYPKVDSESLNN